MASFICPVCSGELLRKGNSYICSGNHCYDISKSGYVNLLMSQKTQNHGDDKLMVRARRDFLEKGYYNKMRTALADTVKHFCKPGDTVIDAGCGECFYTSYIYDTLRSDNIDTSFLAIDISKNALAYAKHRNPDIHRAVASIFHIPVADRSCDILINVFAPYCEKEFQRVIKKDGIYIQVIPLRDHLWSLKKAVYDVPYKNVTDEYFLNGFELVKSREIKGKITLESNDDIKNLFMMTPYYYKTSAADFKKLDNYDSLTVETEFALLAYKRVG